MTMYPFLVKLHANNVIIFFKKEMLTSTVWCLLRFLKLGLT